MDLDFLKNPWVLGGGLVVGVLVLTMGKGGSTNAAPNNTSMFAYATESGAQAVQLQTSMATINAKDQADFRSLLLNSMATQDNYAISMEKLRTSVVLGNIQSNTALALDKQDNATKVVLGQDSVDATGVAAQASMHNADTNANAQIQMAQTQAQSNIFGSIFKGISSIFAFL